MTKRTIQRPSRNDPGHGYFHRLVLLAVLLTVAGAYPVLNQPWETLHSTLSLTDTRIPLIPIFVIPYLFFFFPWLVGLVIWSIIRNGRAWGRLAVALTLALLFSYTFYTLYQTVVIRPLPEDGGVWSDLLRWVYRSDARYNAFPSTHTVMTVILFATTWSVFRNTKARAAAAVAAVLIIASTLFTKQHYLADVLGGVAIGLLSLLITAIAVPIIDPHRPAARLDSTLPGAPDRPTRRRRSRRGASQAAPRSASGASHV